MCWAQFYNALDLNNQKILWLPSIYEFERKLGFWTVLIEIELTDIQNKGWRCFEWERGKASFPPGSDRPASAIGTQEIDRPTAKSCDSCCCCWPSTWLNPHWHELWKQEKCSSLAPPRGIFYMTQWAFQGVKLIWLMPIFTSKKVWKFLIKIQLTKSNPKRTRR